ncbi:uncharacterized protein B0H18DRAFT_1082813 [Fomitopsis serialis]|uniref:uncharacterized protein n=1 Tax=Fomitopsis serialis TaxID=139415 RepID=UPI0020089D03|nr:uncharacterized protein B0H18DRAFT_1082813 [Neoantrodia serialis]KAH9934248.1 hypothetical protein B0H18DRAFT_1082813 [Neoantrodia serialis]
MGCATKNAKVVMISLGSLQRLIALKAVPQSAVPVIISTMGDCMNQGVDIQLRILQTLLSLITNFPAIHGQLLGDALLLCFKLQESRIAVVSSTAAATLRQLVMFIVDKVVDEDRRDEVDLKTLVDITLPNGETKALGPSARDAYAVFEDLCLLANAERPRFLKLEVLRKTFALELIESVLTNYHDLFRKHPELLLLQRHHLSPLLLKALSDRPSFPLTLRATRVVFLLLKQFSGELKTESEVFLMLLIKIVGSDGDADPAESGHPYGSRPLWMRVLAMEIMRGDAELIRNVWERYDAEEGGSKVFTSLITALKRLVTEKPALLGVCTQMFGVGVPTSSGSSSDLAGYGLDVGGVAGMVATAASATVSAGLSMIGSEAGLSLHSSAMKLQCIDQLDKADSPVIPESYVYLLGLQCLVALCEGFASFTGPLYNSLMIQRPRSAGEPVVRAPPALDLSALPTDEPTTHQLRTVHAMVESGWPALLAALSFLISTNLSDELFVEVLASYQALTTVAGMLGLATPRDAFFTSIARLAIPPRVISSLDTYHGSAGHYTEPMTPRSAATTLSENLGITIGGSVQPPGLSERNMACLKVLVTSGLFLAGSLGESWFNILEALQNADYVLTVRGTKPTASKRGTLQGTGSAPGSRVSSLSSSHSAAQAGAAANQGAGQQPQTTTRHPLLADLDPESMQHAIQRLFDASKNLDDGAFRHFVSSSCKLSAAMIGMQSEAQEIALESESLDELVTSPGLTLQAEHHRRRVSGIHMPKTPRSGDFGISKLGGVAMLNIHRLIYRSPDVAWDPITEHLLIVIRNALAPSTVRVQAARILDDILVVVPRNLSSTGDLQPKVQRRVLDVLARQVIPDSMATNSTTVEVRRMGFETLHQILQASGHTLVIGWETIFEMLSSVCTPTTLPSSATTDSLSTPTTAVPETPRRKPAPLGYTNDKGHNSLVKIAFQSLTLVCDSLGSLSPEHLRLCISTLGKFGRQADTNIALTAAESLLWGVSDSIQAKRKDAETEHEFSALWMFLLVEVLGLCTDARPEVRVGAIQTLFRTLQLYGTTLSLGTWDECIWKITFPLLDSITVAAQQAIADTDEEDSTADPADLQWDESKILALQSIGSIFHEFLLTKLMPLESFSRAWDVFVGHIQSSWRNDNRMVTATALRCLDKSINALATGEGELVGKTKDALATVWHACDDMGAMIATGGSGQQTRLHSNPFTQESLMAFVDVIRSTRSVGRNVERHEWSLERLERLMSILKGVLTYQNSTDYRPDIDALSPVQATVMQAIDGVDLSSPGAPSLVLRDLSEYATLPFLAAFDMPSRSSVVSATPSRSNAGRVTYIALSKKIMPVLVELFLRFKGQSAIYLDGTVERIYSAYAIPIKLKYECPAPSKFGKDPPLWKTATNNFLRIVKECGPQLREFGEDVPDAQQEGIWRQIIETFRGGILADCSAADSFPLDMQETEENFDLALIAALEIDVVPYLGDALSQEFEKVEKFGTDVVALGTTESGHFRPRERFSYWCLDLLFLICSDTAKDRIPARRRLAALSLLSMLERCRATLVHYVADEALRGNLPFPRAREEELLYVLQKLLKLQLWPGTLWAALSNAPSQYCVQQPEPTQLIADAVKRSSKAHLFHFYPILCEIVSIPRRTPSAWVPRDGLSLPNSALSPREGSAVSGGAADGDADHGRPVELDARSVVKECLKEVGKEMGVRQ